MTSYDAIIVGSGPAGVAAAEACLRKGWSTCVVDEGRSLEAAHDRSLRRLAQVPEDAWTPADLAFLYPAAAAAGEFKKSAHGSFFAYADDPDVAKDGVGVERSWATGGFSNVWGGSVLSYTYRQIAGWGLNVEHWADAQREVVGLFRISNSDHRWPGHVAVEVDPASAFDAADLRAQGNYATRNFGPAMVAWTKRSDACTGCQLCLSGCPYELIYNSAETLRGQIARGLAYRSGHRVTSVARPDDLDWRVTTDGEHGGTSLRAKRVFLAAGPVGTPKILMASALIPASVDIRDSQYFLLPALRLRAITRPFSLAVARWFIELYGRRPGGDAHFQLYSADTPLMRTLIERKTAAIPGAKNVLALLLSRLVIVQGYLHSQRSGRMRMTKTDTGFSIFAVRGWRTRMALAWTYLRLFIRGLTRGFLMLPIVTVTEPGRGQHSGGCVPMDAEPRDGTTSLGGELHGRAGLFLVDASALPEIPPHTITLGVMTNAYRIADAAT